MPNISYCWVYNIYVLYCHHKELVVINIDINKPYPVTSPLLSPNHGNLHSSHVSSHVSSRFSGFPGRVTAKQVGLRLGTKEALKAPRTLQSWEVWRKAITNQKDDSSIVDI